MINKRDNNKQRLRRHRRVRGKISGTPDCPRLSVFRSSKHIYAQIIDDTKGITLCSASTMEKSFTAENKANVDAAKKVGSVLAEKAQKVGIQKVVFDRGGYIYHGRVKSLAEGARESGLKF
ncbi:MAG: 50S ribosomal protein L18 [Oscillospiraceae bacterium]|nr:50S ribosomal protein L18 [Oscillospiraceae bacterium]